jgi:xylulokinase
MISFANRPASASELKVTRHKSLILAIDIGTGSARAALVDAAGGVSHLSSQPHTTLSPEHGWVEQSPEDWWQGTVKAIRTTLAKSQASSSIAAVVACGQMHAPVLIDKAGLPVRPRVPLWNDKRASGVAQEINSRISGGSFPAAINPATSAWPGVKLRWMATHDPSALDAAWRLLMPKDYLNFRLTSEVAMDWTKAASSFMSDPELGGWSPHAMRALELPVALLPPLLPPQASVGRITRQASEKTGLPKGIPVFTGAGDFPAAILGSGMTRDDQLSDVTGTSFLLTRPVGRPLIHPDVMNVAMASGGWGAFAVVDAAGDAIRWASRTLDREARSYAEMSAEAATVSAGCDGLIFLPYLTGERLGQGPSSRAAFLGLTASHRAAHLHRAVMEGIVLAMHEAFGPIREATPPAREIVSAAGGARSDLWLQIKADVFGLPVIVPEHVEAGLVGSAALALAGLGRHSTAAEAITQLVRHRPPILPDPARSRNFQDLSRRYAAVRKVSRELNTIFGQ